MLYSTVSTFIIAEIKERKLLQKNDYSEKSSNIPLEYSNIYSNMPMANNFFEKQKIPPLLLNLVIFRVSERRRNEYPKNKNSLKANKAPRMNNIIKTSKRCFFK